MFAGVLGLLLAFMYALHADMRLLCNILIVAAVIVAGALLHTALIGVVEEGSAVVPASP